MTRSFTLRHWRIDVEVASADAGEKLCVVRHRLEGGYVAMPLRRCAGSSVVLQPIRGVLSAQVGDEVVRVSPGHVVLAPAGSWHTFWNARERLIEFQEISAPGGLDRYYEALAPLIPVGGRADVERVFALSAPHGLEFDVESLVDLIERHHVHLA
jgi:mannose-6-phosphate isomerase-like protein (cupin superfamily)